MILQKTIEKRMSPYGIEREYFLSFRIFFNRLLFTIAFQLSKSSYTLAMLRDSVTVKKQQ
jgi:hypothetical protein